MSDTHSTSSHRLQSRRLGWLAAAAIGAAVTVASVIVRSGVRNGTR